MSDFIKTFEYDIVNGVDGSAVDGCAKFQYKGLEVSFSTQGRSQGACPHEVIVFKKNAKSTKDKLGAFTKVQDAIEFINGTINKKVRDLFLYRSTNGENKGVLTKEEAYAYGEKLGNVICISNIKTNSFFFTDNRLFGYRVLGEDFVPRTCCFPMQVVPREGLEDGIIDTIEKFIMICKHDGKIIETIEELAAEII